MLRPPRPPCTLTGTRPTEDKLRKLNDYVDWEPLREFIDPTNSSSQRGHARILGVNPINVRRWRDAGYLGIYTADALAVRLGHHPAEIWPEWA